MMPGLCFQLMKKGADVHKVGNCAPADTAGAGGTVVLSYYRLHAQQCRTLARNAQNQQQRAQLLKMVEAWRAFAVEHERIIHNHPSKIPPRAQRGSASLSRMVPCREERQKG